MIQIKIKKLLEECDRIGEKHYIYPQANDLDKVFDLIAFISRGIKTKKEIADFFDFEKRQADYYFNALNYLGFAEKSETGCVLTKKGLKLSKTYKREKRIKIFVEQLAKRKTWNLFLNIYFFKEKELTKQKVIEILEEEFDDKYAEDTINRRAQCVLSWCKWLEKNINKIN